MRRRQPFNWPAAMAFGLGVLKLPPAAFWAMTPRELDAALVGHYGRSGARQAPSRQELNMLVAEYPDTKPMRETGHVDP